MNADLDIVATARISPTPRHSRAMQVPLVSRMVEMIQQHLLVELGSRHCSELAKQVQALFYRRHQGLDVLQVVVNAEAGPHRGGNPQVLH